MLKVIYVIIFIGVLVFQSSCQIIKITSLKEAKEILKDKESNPKLIFLDIDETIVMKETAFVYGFC